MFRIPGSWYSFDHLEEVLTLDELMLLYTTIHEQLEQDRKFSAAIQGADISGSSDSSGDDADGEDPFERAKRKGQARLAGKSEEALEFEMAGFKFEGDDV